MDSELAKLNVEEVCTLLQSNNFDSDVIAIFRRDKIPGSLMAELEGAEMTDLGIEAWGDRRKLRKLKDSVEVCEEVQLDDTDQVDDMLADSPPTLAPKADSFKG